MKYKQQAVKDQQPSMNEEGVKALAWRHLHFKQPNLSLKSQNIKKGRLNALFVLKPPTHSN